MTQVMMMNRSLKNHQSQARKKKKSLKPKKAPKSPEFINDSNREEEKELKKGPNDEKKTATKKSPQEWVPPFFRGTA